MKGPRRPNRQENLQALIAQVAIPPDRRANRIRLPTMSQQPRALAAQFATTCIGSRWNWIRGPRARSRFDTNIVRRWCDLGLFQGIIPGRTCSIDVNARKV